jgi:hypothetical protein
MSRLKDIEAFERELRASGADSSKIKEEAARRGLADIDAQLVEAMVTFNRDLLQEIAESETSDPLALVPRVMAAMRLATVTIPLSYTSARQHLEQARKCALQVQSTFERHLLMCWIQGTEYMWMARRMRWKDYQERVEWVVTNHLSEAPRLAFDYIERQLARGQLDETLAMIRHLSHHLSDTGMGLQLAKPELVALKQLELKTQQRLRLRKARRATGRRRVKK